MLISEVISTPLAEHPAPDQRHRNRAEIVHADAMDETQDQRVHDEHVVPGPPPLPPPATAILLPHPVVHDLTNHDFELCLVHGRWTS
ncbi:MAG: hypothetical protein ACLP7Q_20795 [Isosphaeraceae bacterium]